MTYEQRQTLKRMKAEGKTGYFYKGALHIRSNNIDQINPRREFRQAIRKLPYESNSKHVTNTDVPVTMETQ